MHPITFYNNQQHPSTPSSPLLPTPVFTLHYFQANPTHYMISSIILVCMHFQKMKNLKKNYNAMITDEKC